MAEVALSEFLPDGLEPLAGAQAPLPFALHPASVRLLPSPALTSLILPLMEVQDGLGALFLGGLGGYAEALAAKAGCRVTVVETDPVARRLMAMNLAAGGHAVNVAGETPPGRWDRVVVASGTAAAPRHLLGEGGILLERRGHRLVRTVRDPGGFLEIDVQGLGGEEGVDVHALLATEELLENAWREGPVGTLDRHFQEVVDTTFAPDFLEVEQGWEARWLALKAFHLGYIHQALGHLPEAQDLYRRSLTLRPTAEAHTFLGWTHSFRGRLEEAMAECSKAIEVDPSLGNPFNDLGAYLLEQGKPDAAIPWLKKALDAPRYCCYFYAHCNLGRAYMLLGLYGDARRQLQEALELNPQYEIARAYLEQLDRALAGEK